MAHLPGPGAIRPGSVASDSTSSALLTPPHRPDFRTCIKRATRAPPPRRGARGRNASPSSQHSDGFLADATHRGPRAGSRRVSNAEPATHAGRWVVGAGIRGAVGPPTFGRGSGGLHHSWMGTCSPTAGVTRPSLRFGAQPGGEKCRNRTTRPIVVRPWGNPEVGTRRRWLNCSARRGPGAGGQQRWQQLDPPGCTPTNGHRGIPVASPAAEGLSRTAPERRASVRQRNHRVAQTVGALPDDHPFRRRSPECHPRLRTAHTLRSRTWSSGTGTSRFPPAPNDGAGQ